MIKPEILEKKKRGVIIKIYLDHDTNERLEESAIRSKRSKEREAAARIDHHLSLINKLPVGY